MQRTIELGQQAKRNSERLRQEHKINMMIFCKKANSTKPIHEILAKKKWIRNAFKFIFGKF